MTNPTLHWRTVEVVDRESVTVPDRGEMMEWKVHTGNTSLWPSKEAPYFLKAESVGGSGQVTTFEIVSWAPGDR